MLLLSISMPRLLRGGYRHNWIKETVLTIGGQMMRESKSFGPGDNGAVVMLELYAMS